MENLLNSPQALIEIWGGIYVSDVSRYLLFASLMAGFLTVFSTRLQARKLQSRTPKKGQRAREIRFSLLTVAVIACWGVAAAIGSEFGITKIYGEIGQYGWAYLIGSTVLMIIVHDAYFYWTHRLIHHPLLFKWFHRTHHRSRTPTPWAAYAFDPGEAAINGAIVALFTIFVPMHPLGIFLFVTHMIARNVIGHSGYELFPKNMKHHPVFGALTNVMHHDLHHRDMGHNYGLYFSWWDRWMGTEHPEYLADGSPTPDGVSQRSIRAAGQNLALAVAIGLALFASIAVAVPDDGHGPAPLTSSQAMSGVSVVDGAAGSCSLATWTSPQKNKQ